MEDQHVPSEHIAIEKREFLAVKNVLVDGVLNLNVVLYQITTGFGLQETVRLCFAVDSLEQCVKRSV